jgi:hypothetical protein
VSGFAILLNLLFTETVHHHLQESLAGPILRLMEISLLPVIISKSRKKQPLAEKVKEEKK